MTNRRSLFWTYTFAQILSVFAGTDQVTAEMISLAPVQDNTLFEFDPNDLESPLNSNGAGDFFSAGRTRSRGALRRGLIQFDFSALPFGAEVVPGTLELTLQVVDSPNRDASGESRPFWILPLEQAWGEGLSEANVGVSGAGSGAAATAGSATWLHTNYDPITHDPRNPDASMPGHWTLMGAIGNTPVHPITLGDPAGIVPAAPYLGPVKFVSASMEANVDDWLANAKQNFGWLVLGDEQLADPEQSSNRGFASREDTQLAPVLSFEYRIVPEPAASLLFAGGLLTIMRRRTGKFVLGGRFSDHSQ